MSHHHLIVRAASPADAAALRDLAVLARRGSPRGHVLLAERDSVPVAAISLTTGAIVSDPADASADAVRSLRTRRWRLLRPGSGPARHALRRLATLPAG